MHSPFSGAVQPFRADELLQLPTAPGSAHLVGQLSAGRGAGDRASCVAALQLRRLILVVKHLLQLVVLCTSTMRLDNVDCDHF